MHFNELTIDQVITLHTKALNKDGGEDGILDINKIESSLNNVCLENYRIPEIAGIFLFRFCKNHAFVDGNKRVAFLVSQVFLKLNNYKYIPKKHNIYYLIMDVASSKQNQEDCMSHFMHNVCKINNI